LNSNTALLRAAEASAMGKGRPKSVEV